MQREVLRYAPVTKAVKTATAQRWRPVSEEEILARAPEIDALYERAIGLDKRVDPAIRPMLEAQMPTLAARRVVTKGLIEVERAMQFVAHLDFRLWWYVIAAVLVPESAIPDRVRIRGYARMTKVYEHLLKDRYANLVP